MLDWEGFAESWEAVIEAALEMVADGNEIAAARAAYFDWVGKPLDDEASHERRNRAFLEWFVCERPLAGAGETPRARLAAAGGELADAAAELADHELVAATVAKVGDNELVLKRWLVKAKLNVAVGHTAGLARRAAVLGRTFHLAEGSCLSPVAETVEPALAKGLKTSVLWAADADADEADLYGAAMRFELMRQRYPKAQPEELEARWRELMTPGDGGE